FVYGPEHQRTKQISSVNGTTYYLNGTDGQALDFEKEVKASVTENKHFITAGGAVVAQYTTRSNGVNDLRYFHTDHLGSTSVITDEAGAVVERLAYDPWGKRQFANGGTPPEGYTPTTTDRGFTMHEHLDEMGIIHMNGRVYDPTLGRFMSADPYIQAPDNLLSYNRYAYCAGNPLNCTDPSGYFSLSGMFKAAFNLSINPIKATNHYAVVYSLPGAPEISKVFQQNAWLRVVGHAAAGWGDVYGGGAGVFSAYT